MREPSANLLVWKDLRERRRQNLGLAIGVAMAVFFLAVCVFGAASVAATVSARSADRNGEADYWFLNTEGLDIPSLFPAGFRLKILEQELLFGSLGEEDSAADDFAVARYDADVAALLHTRLREGRFPEAAGEIAIEAGALSRMRSSAVPGDTLTLRLASWDGEEYLRQTEEREFLLVGILENGGSDMGRQTPALVNAVPEALVSPEEPLVIGSRAVIDSYVRVLGWRSRLTMYRAAQDYVHGYLYAWGEEGSPLGNSQYLYLWGRSLMAFFIEGGSSVVILLFAVLAALLAAVLGGISSAMGAGLDKRRQQVGMLRAIGATGTQVRSVLRRETALLALLTMPAGIGAGALCVWGIGRLWPSVGLRPVITWPLALLCAACSLLFLLAATARPLGKAARISPMQALRDVEMLRRQRETHARSRRAYVPQRLIASRNIGFHRGRMAAIVLLIAAGTLLVSFAYLAGTRVVESYGETLTADYRINTGWWGGSGEFLQEADDGQNYTAADKADILAVPWVGSVSSEQSAVVDILLDELTEYVTGEGWSGDLDYFFPEGPAYIHAVNEATGEYDSQLAGVWEAYTNYTAMKEQYGIDEDVLAVTLTAVSEDQLSRLSSAVYDGAIDADALNAGREVLLAAPQQYYEEFEIAGIENGRVTGWRAGYYEDTDPTSWIYQTHYQEGRPIYGNDTFFVGDVLRMCQLTTASGVRHTEEGTLWPTDAKRTDASPTIGALLKTTDNSLLIASRFAVVTTEQGAAALGLDAPYVRFEIRLTGEPGEEERAAVTQVLEDIAERAEYSQLYDYYESARADREAYRMILTGSVVAIVLLFAFVAALVNGSVSGRIHSEVRQIGTMRAVGADMRAVSASYTLQVLRLMAAGGGAGLALFAALWTAMNLWRLTHGGLRLLSAEFLLPLLTPAVFLLPLAALCCLSVRSQLRPIFRKPVVENIRIL